MGMEQQSAKSAENLTGWQALPKWTKVITIILVLIALGFGASLLHSSQAIVGTVHKRNFHIVDIAAHGLETWQRDVTVMARNNVSLAKDVDNEGRPSLKRDADVLLTATSSGNLKSMEYHHPDLGDFRIYYRDDCTIPRKVRFEDGILSGQGTRFIVQGEFDNNANSRYQPKGKTSCFVVSVQLHRLVDMRFDNREISNFLIVARDGRVIEQLGDGRLPIVSIGKLGATGGLAEGIVAKVSGEKVAALAPVGLDEVRNVAPITIGGTDYLAYIKPFKLTDDGAACPPEDNTMAAVKSANTCFAVALMPAKSLRQSWLSPPPTITIGFGLALAAFLALLPLIRLLLIGGTESIGGIEVLGIMLGLPAATTIAAFAIQFAIDVTSERTIAERETGAVAHRLASQAGGEIDSALSAAFYGRRDNVISKAMDTCPKREAPSPVLVNCPLGFGKGGLQLELFLKIGPDGKLGQRAQSYAFRENMTPSFDVSARDYFLRLRRGGGLIFPTPSGQNSSIETPPCVPRDGQLRFTIDQVRSQTDGYDKTVLALPCPEPATDSSVLMVLTLRAFLAPVLPEPLHFMVIDTSKPDFPVVFHKDKGHAGLESFAEQSDLSVAQAGELVQLGKAPKDATHFGFRVSYDGERTIFSAVKVANTQWLVLAWQRVDDADGIAARTASRAMVAWVAIALIFLLTCAIAIAVTGSAWRQFWPHESARMAYIHLFRVFATAALALLAKLYCGETGAVLFLAFMLLIWLSVVNKHRKINGDSVSQGHMAMWWRAASEAMPNLKSWKPISRAILLIILVVYLVSLVSHNSPLYATLGLWAFAPAYAAWQLEAPKDSDDPLTPETEKAYRNALLAFFICIALVPAIMLWNQARMLSHHLANNDRLIAAKQALVTRAETGAGIRRAIFSPPKQNGAATNDRGGLPLLRNGSDALSEAKAPRFAGALWELQTGVPVRSINTCAGLNRSDWLCVNRKIPNTESAFATGVVPRKKEFPQFRSIFGTRIEMISPFVALGVIAAIGMLLSFVWQATSRMLDALAGFRVPLGAVKGRKILLAEPGTKGGWERRDVKQAAKLDKLARAEGLGVRTLLVAPQQAARNRLTSYPEAWSVDLADLLLDKESNELKDKAVKDAFVPQPNKEGERKALLIVSGLELILRDVPRRQAALKYLETAEQWLAGGKLAGVIVIAEMSPLERILDAFESGGTVDESTKTTREELRWARLFQTFETIIFAPVNKIHSEDFPMNLPRPIWRLIAEMRWLPAIVIDGTTGTDRTAELSTLADAEFPLGASVYQECYKSDILGWAQAVSPCSEEAAIDHLRSTLIEHYEQCWVASTHAERLVLDAIARGHFVNIARALPLQSLVRRGLVVLDPSPRLMNRSFALFVCQAERPNTLKVWRKDQPRSNWMAARLPLLIAIPVAIVGLTLAAAESGQELTAIFSVLAAGAPALLSAFFKAVRPA
jgi:hypothetical protein